MSGQREAVARWLCSNMHRHGVAPSACEVAPGQADDLLAHLAAAPVAADREHADSETVIERLYWELRDRSHDPEENREWAEDVCGVMRDHIAAVVAAAREAALAGVRARIEAVLRQFTHDAECRHAQGFDVPCDCYMSDLMPELRTALADAGPDAPPADEGSGL